MKSIDELLSIKSIDGPLSTATEHEHACCRILFVIECSDASAIRNLQKECYVCESLSISVVKCMKTLFGVHARVS